MGVSPPQVSTLVRRLREEGVIDRSGGRFVLKAAAASTGGFGGAKGEAEAPGAAAGSG